MRGMQGGSIWLGEQGGDWLISLLGRVGVRKGVRKEGRKGGRRDGFRQMDKNLIPLINQLLSSLCFLSLCTTPYSLPLLPPLPVSSTLSPSLLFFLSFSLPLILWPSHIHSMSQYLIFMKAFFSFSFLSFVRMNYFKRNRRMFLHNRIFMK